MSATITPSGSRERGPSLRPVGTPENRRESVQRVPARRERAVSVSVGNIAPASSDRDHLAPLFPEPEAAKRNSRPIKRTNPTAKEERTEVSSVQPSVVGAGGTPPDGPPPPSSPSEADGHPEGEDLMALARAMDKRETTEFLRREREFRTSQGYPKAQASSLPNEISCLMLKTCLEERSTNLAAMAEKVAVGINDTDALRINQSLPGYTSMGDLTPEEIGRDIRRLVRGTLEKVGEMHINLNHVLRIADGAQSVASERNVPRTEVYRRDDLYNEAIRQSYTPATFAATLLDIIPLSADTRERGYLRNEAQIAVASQDPSARLDYGSFALRVEREMVRLHATLRNSTAYLGLKITWAQEAKLSQALGVFAARSDVSRIWGQEGLDSLPEDLKQKLRITGNK